MNDRRSSEDVRGTPFTDLATSSGRTADPQHMGKLLLDTALMPVASDNSGDQVPAPMHREGPAGTEEDTRCPSMTKLKSRLFFLRQAVQRDT
jgi:hypothetical protein